MKNCYDEGALRAYLDGEAPGGDRDAIERHLNHCAACSDRLREVRDVAAQVGATFSLPDPGPIAGRLAARAAFRRLEVRLARPESRRQAFMRRLTEMTMGVSRARMYATGAVLAVMVLLVSVVAIPPVRLAAEQMLGIMKVQKFAPVTIDLASLPRTSLDLSQLGDMGQLNLPKIEQATSLDQVQQRVGFKPAVPSSLPDGIPSQADIRTVSTISFTYTFNVKKAQDYLQRTGQTNFSVPPKFDGAKLTAQIPPIAVFGYGISLDVAKLAQGGKPNGIVVVEMQSPTLSVDGQVTPTELRDLLLSIPGLPQSTIDQIKAIGDWENTLPVPVPQNYGVSETVSVDGTSGLMVTDKAGTGGVVMWEKDGVVYGVAGTVAKDQLLATARSVK